MSYEKNKKTLEEIVNKLSSENISIKESLALYEKGIKTASECLNELNNLKAGLTMLNADMEKLNLDEGEENEE